MFPSFQSIPFVGETSWPTSMGEIWISNVSCALLDQRHREIDILPDVDFMEWVLYDYAFQ